jgi:hypothetical protein
MFKSGKAKKVFFAALIFGLVSVGIYCYVFIKIFQENRLVAELNGQIEKLTAEKKDFIRLTEKVSETEAARDKIQSYFIPMDGMVGFLNGLQDIGKGNNLEIKINSVNVITDTSTTTSIFETVSMTSEVVGAWQDVYRFVTLVELLPFGVSINGVNLERTSSDFLPSTSQKKSDPKVSLWRGTVDISVLKLK